MQPSNQYITAVLQKLIDEPMEQNFGTKANPFMLSVSEIIIVPPDTKHVNYPKTINAIKYIIDYGMDVMHGFVITFNSDYSRFKKTIYINQ